MFKRFKIQKYIFFFLVNFSALLANEIIVIIPNRSYIYEQNLAGFLNVFQSRNNSREIVLEEIQNDKSVLNQILDTFGKSEKKYIIAFGQESVEFAKLNFSNGKIIYSMIKAPRNFDLTKGNICGYELSFPHKAYFQVIKEVNPNARNVRSLYSSSLGEYEAKGGEYQDLEHSLIITHKKISKEDDFANEMKLILKDANAFLLIDDPIYTDQNFKLLSNYCKENKILLLTNHIPLIESGASIGIVPDYYQIGEMTGDLANNVISGQTECKFGPFKSYMSNFLYVNSNYLEESGFILSDAFKLKVETSKLTTSGIELYNKGLYKSAQRTFDKILKLDPKNEIGLYYHKKTIAKLTYDETQILISEIENSLRDKKYQKGKELCNKILSKTPDNEQTKNLLEKIRFSESEDLRMIGQSLEKSNQTLSALKKYKESIQVFPINSSSKIALEKIIREEQKKIPNYTKIGLEFYNKRKYRESKEVFENILLIDPNNQNALEYLRLSVLKDKAISQIKDCKNSNQNDCKLIE